MSDRDRSAGSSCRAEVRTIETLERGAPEIPFMGFGAVEQKVVAAAAPNAGFSAGSRGGEIEEHGPILRS